VLRARACKLTKTGTYEDWAVNELIVEDPDRRRIA
jgi:hypothetical protein